MYLTHAGDERLFVVEQGGRIRIVENGEIMEEPFLDVTALVSTDGLERGLLGMAFHPDYPVNGWFFVNYTDSNGDTMVARYTVSTDGSNRADPASAEIILQVDQPYPNHNGGHLRSALTAIFTWDLATAEQQATRMATARTPPCCWAKCCGWM